METYIASFDIGAKNFAFCVEKVDLNMINSINNIQKRERYNEDGTVTEKFRKILNPIYNSGSIVLFKNCDVRENGKSIKTGCKVIDPKVFLNMYNILDSYTEIWDKCSCFVIEQQMSFGKTHNTMALKLGQNCISYFVFKYGTFKQIVEFPSYYKTQILGSKKDETITKKGKVSYKAVSKPERKKWAVEEAMLILADRDDFKTMSEVVSKSKKDDLADTLCQLQAFKYLKYIEKIY